MITFLKLLTMMMSLMLIKNINPIKMSVTLLLLSSLMFLALNEKTQSNWYPLIFFLLFMGGILIMFMILSSLMPNEKTYKMKLTLILPLAAASIFSLQINSQNTNIEALIKLILNSNSSIEFIISIMIFYFLLFVIMISKEKIPLRSVNCHH